MKLLRFILMLPLFVICGFSQTYTNGVFFKDGKTTEIEKKVYQFIPTNSAETLYFSNDLIVRVNTNSDFLVNSFFQEVYDINSLPKKSRFGNANFAASLLKGSAMVKYSGNDGNNSSCIISTPMVDLELHKGTFYFKVSDERILVFVLDGSLTSHGNKGKENVVTTGYAVVARINDIGILENKVSLGAEKVIQSIINELVNEAKNVDDVKKTTIFATVNGKVVGIVIN